MDSIPHYAIDVIGKLFYGKIYDIRKDIWNRRPYNILIYFSPLMGQEETRYSCNTSTSRFPKVVLHQKNHEQYLLPRIEGCQRKLIASQQKKLIATIFCITLWGRISEPLRFLAFCLIVRVYHLFTWITSFKQG